MAKKALKAQLYDKPRYAFDEEQLFHHFSNEKEREEFETKTFPWWKPVWNKDGWWVMVNPDGKEFDHAWFPYTDITNGLSNNLRVAERYGFVSTFFVEWMKQIAYDQSISCWNTHEHIFKMEYPNKRPDQIARMCDDEVAKFFLNLKG